jgi:hypothetical protein
MTTFISGPTKVTIGRHSNSRMDYLQPSRWCRRVASTLRSFSQGLLGFLGMKSPRSVLHDPVSDSEINTSNELSQLGDHDHIRKTYLEFNLATLSF